ncbi:unnamed protein product, partial [marine sediment metagenome]
GTNEYAFQSQEFMPEQYVKGKLAKSWEVSPERIVYHIRSGIMWNECPIMESRELTAYDVALALNRFLAGMRIRWPARIAFIDSVTAEGDTVVVETNSYHPDWHMHIGWGHLVPIYPPELVEADIDDWRSHVGVGTGPFILTEYVEASSANYVKNPDWWDKKKIINGKEYDTPFVDTLVLPWIADESTQIAALRTGRIDWMYNVPLMYRDTLEQTCPGLLLVPIPGGNVRFVDLRCDHEPFDDVNVRRALMIGTDIESII